MSAAVSAVKSAVSTVASAAGSVVKGVGDIVENVAKPVFKAAEKTIDAALQDPVGTIAQVATAVYAPYLLPYVSAANAAAHGASLEKIATSAALGYAGGQVGLQASQLAPLEYAPLVQQAASGATRAAVTGGDVVEGALTSVINSQGNKALNSAVNGPSGTPDYNTEKPAEYTPVEPDSSTDTSQFTGLSDMKPTNYKLFEGLSGTEPGFKAKLDETTTTNEDGTVNYGLSTEPTPETSFGQNPVPSLKSMNGGTGLTLKDAEGGTYGALGYTPANATYALGDPKSFINDPNVTGTPLVQTDDSSNWLLPKVNFAGMLGLGPDSPDRQGRPSGQGGIGGINSTPAKKVDKYGYPTLLDGSELLGDSTGDPYYLERLKQLYGSITPGYQTASFDNSATEPVRMAAGGSSSANNVYEDPFPVAKTPVMNAPFVGGGQRKPIQMTPLHQLKESIARPRGMAKGGLPAKYAEAMPEGHKPEFITGLTGYYASGKGTGQSDDIDAMLHDGDYVADADLVAALGDGSSKAGAEALEKFRRQIPHQQHAEGGPAVAAKIADGEYVFPASFVTAIGQGDNKAGAKILDKMREAIRAHKRSAPTTKIPPKAKSPLEYLKMAKG